MLKRILATKGHNFSAFASIDGYQMEMSALTNWLSLASIPSSSLAFSLVQFRACQIGGLIASSETAQEGLSQRLCAPYRSEVMAGIRELKTRVEQGDPVLVPQLVRRLEQRLDLNKDLARDAAGLESIRTGGDLRALKSAVLGLAVSFSEMGDRNHRQGRLRTSEDLFLRGLSAAESAAHGRHPLVRSLLGRIVAVQLELKKFDRAEFFCRRLLKIIEDEQGKEHPDYARCLVSLAEIYAGNGRGERADRFLRRAAFLLRQRPVT